MRNVITILFFLFAFSNFFSQSILPNFLSFKEDSWTSCAVFDTINGKLKQVGNLKYGINYSNIIIKSFDRKDDTIRKVKDPFSFNELLFEIKSESNNFYVIYLDSLKQRKAIVLSNKYIEYYTPKKMFLKRTFFVYTKNIYNNAVYSAPNESAKKHIDSTRFNCFKITDIKENWVRVITTDGDPCGNYQTGAINSGWIKWYDNGKLLLNIERH